MAFKVGHFDVVENGNNKTPFIFLAVFRSFASNLGYYLTVSSKPPKFPSAFPKDYDKSSAVRRSRESQLSRRLICIHGNLAFSQAQDK